MITRVPGILVGHWTDPTGRTGCTVVLCPPGTVGSGEVRGGAPGTRETDLLRPGTLVQEVHAVLLTGGSAFGLAAADGVMRYLEERGVGFETPAARVPIVPAAVLYDLGVGDAAARPGPEQGYLACAAASADVPEGTVGAGTGATVAKLRGPEGAASGGIGTASVQEGDLVVGAIAAVNALGEVIDDAGAVLVGSSVPAQTEAVPEGGGTNTTLVIVATNATLSKERANLLSQAAHDGIERAIRPAHTLWDGDTAFALATGSVPADQRQLERLGIDVVAEAIRRGCAVGR
ncbi:MAG: P1 family peptidase [Deltaproteobacteria bacterium]|nr:MAG: P1 family peptidase [Deltaproteobacteria bacterium]